MTDEQTITMQDVFEYVQDVGRQSKLIIKDTAQALRKETGCYFKHMKAWDYMIKPKNEHFLDTQFGISRAWVTYVPEGALSLAVLFYIQFYYGKHPVVPSLMYGSLDSGTDKDFDTTSRWASWGAIMDVERKKDSVSVEIDGPFSIVTSTKESRFKEARLVRVPLESITSWEDLQRIVVKPLAALVCGDVEKARELLQEVETIQWPIRFAEIEDEVEEVEEA